MQLNSITSRRYDVWLLAITAAVIAFFVVVMHQYAPAQQHYAEISQLRFVSDPDGRFDARQLMGDSSIDWQPAANPVNLGMHDHPYWFRFSLPASLPEHDADLLEINYPLLDNIDVTFYSRGNPAPLAHKRLGDNLPFAYREIAHESHIVEVPRSEAPIEVLMRVKTSGTIKLPLRLWKEQVFIEYTSQHNLLMGMFFGVLMAIGLSNGFFFLTTRNLSFLVYAGYVFSMMLTLAVLHGQAYAHLWPAQVWFQGRAVVIFANTTIMFAVLFTNRLLQVDQHSRLVSRLLTLISLLFLGNILLSLVLPYAYVIKIFLVMLSTVVVFILSVSVWLAMKGNVLARYHAFAWSILLLSGLTASFDNFNLIAFPVPSTYLLILGAAVETLLLTLVLAISYSHNQEEKTDAQNKALEQEKQALDAQAELMSVQQQYQAELEYQVGERTLELEIALRELSEANRELENLNTIDSLTGIRNRRHFDKRLQAEARLSRREQTPLSLVMVDIDHFKQINDRYGHATGDACLRHVAKLLPGILKRPTDDVCRYGGEEFAIILPNTELEGATQLVDQIRATIEATPVIVDGHPVSMTLSAGVGTTIVGYDEQELALLKLADRMLYAAKQGGRNQVHGQFLTSGQDT
ncbi:diguanylate cyclase [Alteromonas aestuariivivens]|uniref:diguanylate cyclase n=1 Tax=Alteromonas aestuariivivens TaxID=1938339 RepID=A0A3D8MA43_9ALTE|nr:diguanylate cyclase [Alteromonas aestuariivivens]RDV26655.1 diguanylate cyclase [Alteromonas aestuariivivens]